jgi:hypothetical protein
VPIIQGQALTDASGNAVTDASAAAIGEPDLPISLLGGLVVLAGSNPLRDLIDTLTEVRNFLVGLTEGTLTMQALSFLQQDMNDLRGITSADQTLSNAPPHGQGWTLNGVINQIGTPPAPTWPEGDPPWWIPPPATADLSDIPEAVWNWVNPNLQLQQWEVTGSAYLAGQLVNQSVQPMRRDPRFGVWTPAAWGESAVYPVLVYTPHPDFTDMVPTETRLAWLQRTDDSGLLWEADSYTGEPFAALYDQLSQGRGGVVCLFSEAQFNDYAAQFALVNSKLDAIQAEFPIDIPPATATAGAPVWPGSELVTLGETVTLTDQLHLVAECDGVIVNMTTPPTRTGLRQIGGALYDYGVGELAFETDSGDIEFWQYLGFRSGIWTPKTMSRAAGCRFRVLAGAAGTVTPWTRS